MTGRGRHTVRVDTVSAYAVRIGPGVLDELAAAVGDAPCALIGDATALRLHGDRLGALGEASRLEVGPGEDAKRFAELERALDFLAAARLDRSARIVGFGGGAACDLTGLAAAMYMRGVDVVHAPTTLLAQVDASVGGKTAVNLAAGKNLAGVFHQPRSVLCDTSTLATLAPAEWRSGLGEVLKTALLAGEDFLAWLEREADALAPEDAERATEVVTRCVRHKAAVVAADERETGRRRELNLGHTFAHAIERAAGYGRIPHGLAVSAGIGLALEAARAVGILTDDSLPARVARLQQRLNLPRNLADVQSTLGAPLDSDSMHAALSHDKKARRAEPRFVLPESAGRVRTDVAIDPGLVRRLLGATPE